MGVTKTTEATFQRTVTDYASLCGWEWHHHYDSRRSRKGFPDLVLVRGKRIVYAELKVAGGNTSPEQRRWLKLLSAAGAEVYLWFPTDWAEIAKTLAPAATERPPRSDQPSLF